MASSIRMSSRIVGAATSTGWTFKVFDHNELTDTGKIKEVFVSCNVPINAPSRDEAIAQLAILKTPAGKPALINWSVPKERVGGLVTQVKPVMTAERSHVLCVAASDGNLAYHSSLSRETVNGHLAALQLPLLPPDVVNAPEPAKITGRKSKLDLTPVPVA